jgi:hypothetical protein
VIDSLQQLAIHAALKTWLLLGSDAVKHAGDADATRVADADRWTDISMSTDFDARGALPDLRF